MAKRQRLTKRIIDSLKPQDQTYFAWDNDVRGLGVRVTITGLKTFVLDYVNRDGKRRRCVIGAYGPFTLETARKAAGDRLRDIGDQSKGGDPFGKPMTFGAFAKWYLDAACPSPREKTKGKKSKESTVKINRCRLNRVILPRWKDRQVSSIKKSDVAIIIKEMPDTPSVNRVRSLISAMMAIAIDEGIHPGPNPTIGVGMREENKRERYATAEEYARIAKAINELELSHSEKPKQNSHSPAALNAIKMILFTGARRGEILGLQWSEIDFAHSVIHKADSKTGAKPIFLNQQAIDIIDKMPRVSPYVFPSERSEKNGQKPLNDIRKAWAKVCEKAKVEGLRVHDLRHSYAAVAAGMGVSLHQIGGLLGHKNASTTARYAHLAPDPMRMANNAIGEAIAQMMTGSAKIEEARPDLKEKDQKPKKGGATG